MNRKIVPVLESVPENFQLELTEQSMTIPGVHCWRLTMHSDRPRSPEPFRLSFHLPQGEACGRWTATAAFNKNLPPEWGSKFQVNLACGAPVWSFFTPGDRNRIAVASSELRRSLVITAGVREEDAEIHCRIDFFTAPEAPLTDYSTLLRLDLRAIGFADAIRDAFDWLDRTADDPPPPTPECARRPSKWAWPP